MDKANSQIFEMENGVLYYDNAKSILLCKEPGGDKSRWVKKINDIYHIDAVTEDPERYYLSCESDETLGYLLALNIATGATEWFIPGKALFQILYNDYLYLIFADERKKYYLIKVECSDGTKIWHRSVAEDLCEYSFREERILLTYHSGRTECISPVSGRDIP